MCFGQFAPAGTSTSSLGAQAFLGSGGGGGGAGGFAGAALGGSAASSAAPQGASADLLGSGVSSSASAQLTPALAAGSPQVGASGASAEATADIADINRTESTGDVKAVGSTVRGFVGDLGDKVIGGNVSFLSDNVRERLVAASLLPVAGRPGAAAFDAIENSLLEVQPTSAGTRAVDRLFGAAGIGAPRQADDGTLRFEGGLAPSGQQLPDSLLPESGTGFEVPIGNTNKEISTSQLELKERAKKEINAINALGDSQRLEDLIRKQFLNSQIGFLNEVSSSLGEFQKNPDNPKFDLNFPTNVGGVGGIFSDPIGDTKKQIEQSAQSLIGDINDELKLVGKLTAPTTAELARKVDLEAELVRLQGIKQDPDVFLAAA